MSCRSSDRGTLGRLERKRISVGCMGIKLKMRQNLAEEYIAQYGIWK